LTSDLLFRNSLSRRAFVISGTCLLAGTAAAADFETGERREWLSFRSRFVQPDGRVIDTGNGGESHSEGQGYGMLFAARFGDRDAFQRINDWRRRVLRRPDDQLHAWRCNPGAGDVVEDSNNATDGDILIAWGLLEAAARWQDRELLQEGRALAADILRLLVRRSDGRTVLIPGLRGFERADYLVVNPSYYIFPAIPVLATAVPDPAWVRVAADGILLLRSSLFGRWQLPPDWLAVAGRTTPSRPAPGWPTRFAYDAVRVPLYMVWAGLDDEPAVSGTANFWGVRSPSAESAWVDLVSGQYANYPPPTGFRAVARLAISASGNPLPPGQMPHVEEAEDYYSAALTMLARLAQYDARLVT
jgi:endoglucanase